jgi:hypothetical protein
MNIIIEKLGENGGQLCHTLQRIISISDMLGFLAIEDHRFFY